VRLAFDRLLIAQTMVETMRVVSIDAVLDAHGVTRLW
jgi:PIN domain nuclease of toxin-antitoxin system